MLQAGSPRSHRVPLTLTNPVSRTLYPDLALDLALKIVLTDTSETRALGGCL